MRMIAIALTLISIAFSANAMEAPKRILCIFDPIGGNGPIFSAMQQPH